nr:hypothetical protein [uncultured Rhodopila sp.]
MLTIYYPPLVPPDNAYPKPRTSKTIFAPRVDFGNCAVGINEDFIDPAIEIALCRLPDRLLGDAAAAFGREPAPNQDQDVAAFRPCIAKAGSPLPARGKAAGIRVAHAGR